MRLEVGKRYIRRDGTVTPPLTKEGRMFIDIESSLLFSNDQYGCFVLGPGMEDNDDLVGEYNAK